MGKDCDVCEDDELTKTTKQNKSNKIASANAELELTPNVDK